ncbi:MAG: guanylate kinase [Chthonomonadales bacterium]|nr:guanylate kinase [Chthonomonadales bacterium]
MLTTAGDAPDEPLLADGLTAGRGRLFVVSGPSGVGKDAVLGALLASEARPTGIVRCVTATTRAPREGEVEGRDYQFLARDEFERRVQGGWFLEHAVFGANRYGTPRGAVDASLAAGVDVILKIEVQGALQVREVAPGAVLVFLAPPSWEALRERLSRRATEHAAAAAARLERAREEIAMAPLYDYVITNDRLAAAVDALRCVVVAERCRIRR